MIGTGAQRVAKGKVVAFGLLLVAFMAASLLGAKPAHAVSTFTVDSTADTNLTACTAAANDCTLRGAINAANSTANSGGSDLINFAIPGAGVKTIAPNSALPGIIQPVTIDGYTQPGATPNTNSKGAINANLLIELDGTNAGAGLGVGGLIIGGNASNTVIRGLVINDFGGGAGIIVSQSGITGVKIEGNFIGTNATGDVEQGNSSGVDVSEAANNTIGGTSSDRRNLISGNTVSGVSFSNSTGGNQVQGNLIGTEKDGISVLGNLGFGIRVLSGSNNIVGGNASQANTIAFNGRDGVTVSSGTGNRILRNSIFSNANLGIDLGDAGDNGPTANDPKDPDTGPNNLQNFPEINSVKTKGKKTKVKATLESTPSQTFIIQFFSNTQADPSGNGEGKTFLGETSVTTDSSGNAAFAFKPSKKVKAGLFVTATATNDNTGDTSEFSAAVTAS